jgi:hypothetical protein
VLGLNTNLAKSKLVHVEYVDNVVELAEILGYGVVSAHEVSWYLFGASCKAKNIWGTAIEKIECWLTS